MYETNSRPFFYNLTSKDAVYFNFKSGEIACPSDSKGENSDPVLVLIGIIGSLSTVIKILININITSY